MKLFAPDYYKDFHCLMGACRHSCCVGWEIDIDEDTREYYRSVPGEIGERLQKSISDGEEISSFRLTADERCPFLNREGLCDLILALGEDCLCQICADHPRFRNFFSDRTEIGLGLCCEAAGKLILSKETPAKLEVIDDDGEEDALLMEEQNLLELRDALISIAQDRSVSVENRLLRILDRFDLSLPRLSPDFLLSLERLDKAWTERLESLSAHLEKQNLPDDAPWENAFEQLLVYLLFRHLPTALDDGDLSDRIAFIGAVWQLIRALCSSHIATHGRIAIDDLVEITRLYSSEIEYSDENILAILDEISKTDPGRF